MEQYTLKIDSRTSLCFIGPPLSAGPCPAVMYFALSAEENLYLDPYNQPALFLSSHPIRVFSITLPGHEDFSKAKNALATWAKEIEEGIDPISNFIDQALNAIAYLIEENIAVPSKIAVMGLSRGAYFALHVGARCPEVKWILGFSPLINFSDIFEFDSIKDCTLLQSFQSDKLLDSLINKEIRLYIGNRDTRVGTENSFLFIEKIAMRAFQKKRKEAPAELIIYPSIGYKGHGTGKNTFKEGCLWLKEKLI